MEKPFGVSDDALDGGACYSSEPPRDDAPVWNGGDWEKSGWHPYRNSRGEITSWYRYHIEDIHEREYRGAWSEQLPPGEHPVLLTAEQIAAHPLLKGERCQGQFFVHERSEPPTRSAHALYAYPLAGVLWLGLDVPATMLGHLPLAPLLPWMYPVD